MKELFEKPTAEILQFRKRDIITTSIPTGSIPDDGGIVPPFDDFQ